MAMSLCESCASDQGLTSRCCSLLSSPVEVCWLGHLLILSDEVGDPGCRTCSAILFNIPVRDLLANLLSDRGGDNVGRCLCKVHTAPSLVAVKAVSHVEVLLEMVAQREVQKRALVRRQLHRRRQPTLHHRQIPDGEVTVQLLDIATHFDPLH